MITGTVLFWKQSWLTFYRLSSLFVRYINIINWSSNVNSMILSFKWHGFMLSRDYNWSLFILAVVFSMTTYCRSLFTLLFPLHRCLLVCNPAFQTMCPFLRVVLSTGQSRFISWHWSRLFFFVFFLFSSLPSAGKSVVSEPEDEVQATEVGGGGLRVSAEEERIASHKPVEAGD